MLYILDAHEKNIVIGEAIKICKSDSGAKGTKLRKAHELLGETMATSFCSCFSEYSVVIAFMRAAIPFAYGFANKLDSTVLFYDAKCDLNFFEDNKSLLANKDVVFIDAVINSGKEMLAAIEKSRIPKDKIKVVTNVLCHKAIETFKDYEIFATRVSNNSFKGGKVEKQINEIGPDTGDRLFRTM